ncbi:MAG: hypothetical protein ACTJFR_07150 [Canibacter sp.]
MRELTPDQLLDAAALIVTLLIFFSIDAKFRFRKDARRVREEFRIVTIIGGLSSAVALVVVWINLFIPDDMDRIHMLTYFVPSSIAILSALVLSLEVLFFRKDSDDDTD